MITSQMMSYGYCCLLFAVACIGMYRYKHLRIPFRVLAWSVVASFLISIASKFSAIKFGHNHTVLQVESIEEYIFYSLVYYYLFKSKKVKLFIFASIIVVVILFGINAIFLQPFFTEFPTNINVISQLMYAIFSLMLFKEMLNYPVKVNIVKQSVFWFNATMLFFATTMFFNLGISNYLSERNFEDLFVSYLWYFDIYLFHIFICIALLTENKKNNGDAMQLT